MFNLFSKHKCDSFNILLKYRLNKQAEMKHICESEWFVWIQIKSMIDLIILIYLEHSELTEGSQLSNYDYCPTYELCGSIEWNGVRINSKCLLISHFVFFLLISKWLAWPHQCWLYRPSLVTVTWPSCIHCVPGSLNSAQEQWSLPFGCFRFS